jgi:nucleoside-diphosphate-sugar epimerase
MTTKSVLITGIAGFVGSHVAEEALRRGWRVRGIDSLTDYYDVDLKRANLEWLKRIGVSEIAIDDINSVNLHPLVARADAVIHLAGQPGVRPSWSSFNDYLYGNLLTTHSLLEACRGTGKSFLLASSSSVYGNGCKSAIAETSPTEPISPYGVSKLAAEKLCLAYSVSFDVTCTALRFFTVYGPRQRPDMAIQRLLLAAKSGQPFELFGDGSQAREFTYVQDVAEAVAAVVETELESGTILNVGGGRPVSMNTLITCVERVSGKSINVIRSETQKGDVRVTWSDSSRARTLLGWSPATPLEIGLRQQYEWITGQAQPN